MLSKYYYDYTERHKDGIPKLLFDCFHVLTVVDFKHTDLLPNISLILRHKHRRRTNTYTYIPILFKNLNMNTKSEESGKHTVSSFADSANPGADTTYDAYGELKLA